MRKQDVVDMNNVDMHDVREEILYCQQQRVSYAHCSKHVIWEIRGLKVAGLQKLRQ